MLYSRGSMMRIYSVILFIAVLKITNCARILGIFTIPFHSHHVMYQPIWKELSLRGHNVTLITAIPDRDTTLSNLTEIDISFIRQVIQEKEWPQKMLNMNLLQKLMFIYDVGSTLVEEGIKYEPVQKMIKDENVGFDVVIIQNTFVAHGFVARFNAPLIVISTLSSFLNSHDALGNPTHPIISPDIMLNFSGTLSFFDKVRSLIYNFTYRIFYYWYALPKSDKLARKYFGDDMPYLGDLEKNISLMLVNTNPIIHAVRPNVPNMIEINQVHIKERKPLPKEVQYYLDSAPHGVVYFSLGSNVKSANLTKSLREVIVSALAELPYKVLWKWETDYLPNQPDNVMIRKWLPQQDILAHSNVKVFVFQGGMQSIEEAIYFEVPMVAMPFITDQPANVKKLVDQGIAVEVNYKTLTKEILKDAILKVAQDKKFKEEIAKTKAILVDQPIKGVDKAVWWIEYVIRHKGAKHLRSAAADMSFFEYFMVDVVLFLLGCLTIILYCIFKILQLIIYLLKTTKKIKKQ